MSLDLVLQGEIDNSLIANLLGHEGDCHQNSWTNQEEQSNNAYSNNLGWKDVFLFHRYQVSVPRLLTCPIPYNYANCTRFSAPLI